jgi:hypothetical protein
VWGRAWGGPAITLRVGALAVRRSPGSRTDAHRPASIPVRATTVCTSVHSPDFVCDFHALFGLLLFTRRRSLIPAAQAHTTRLCAPRGCERAKRSCLLVLISKLSAAPQPRAPACGGSHRRRGGAGAVAAPGLRLFPDPGAWVLSRPRIIIADHADSVVARSCG